MTLSRKDFFKKTCIAGACLCGFGSMVLASAKNPELPASTEEEDKKLMLVQEYLNGLLQNIQANLPEDEQRKSIKNLAIVHYKQLNMDEFLKPYEGNIESFIGLLEKEWKWKVTYNETTKILIADENKNFCVCPMVNQKSGVKPASICYCSEGFSELMFSKVLGKPVSAKVVSSIFRGDASCRYQIEMS